MAGRRRTALRPVAEVVNRAATSGVLRPEVDPPTVSLALWATVHGLVSLHLRGLHPADAPAPARSSTSPCGRSSRAGSPPGTP